MRVAVFGAGYAGLTVARRLERHAPDDVELVVVDESESHLVQHELHRVVRRPSLADTITVPLSAVLSEAEVRQARVTGIDADDGVATLAPVDGDGETTLEYDVGAVCLGAETAFYDLPGVEDHATPLKRLADARKIHDDTLTAAGGHAVVGGAGLSGVQVAGELAALSAAEGLDLDVTVVERSDSVASGFDPAFRTALRQELDARDVTVETGVGVKRADEDAVHLADGRTLPADVFVWTGGIHGPAAFEGDRPRVESDLQVSDSTFVVGDAGKSDGDDGTTAPASAQTAIRQARVTAKNVRQRIEEATDDSTESDGADDELATYEYDSLGWVVSVGDGAVAQVGPAVLSGEPARAAKAVIGAGHLSSVGALGDAADLVAEEFGWPTHESVVSLGDLPIKQVPTDPGSPSELQSTLGATGLALADAFAPSDAVDLTFVTRLADRRYPGSPVNLLERSVVSPLSLFGSQDENR
ncbi:NAD(P)/FAD-dependent oxidoreductase [Halorientalis brevis]|uniref:NAD(P)/FAD-dependent oxidoreductase n=1 Tax=Halorientalis brevis TaxID=1126241 RepID=A0ABD6C8C5_9EURY